MQLYDDAGRVMPPPVAQAPWALDGWTTYTVMGSEEEVNALVAALGGGGATRITPGAAQLRFGDQVGDLHIAPLGRVVVSNDKLDEEGFDALLAQVAARAATLPFAASTVSAVPFDRALATREDLLYHAFAYLRHLTRRSFGHSSILEMAYGGVLARPHRRLVQTSRRVPTSRARRINHDTLVDVVAGRFPMRPVSNLATARALGGVLPAELDEMILSYEVDTVENRFAKALLRLCEGIVAGVRQAAAARDMRRVLRDCDRVESALRPIARHSMWRAIGEMVYFPTSSTVLQRRHDYRALFEAYTRLRLGSRLPASPEQIRRLLEVKDAATLYELWSCFALIDAVTETLGQAPDAAARPTSTALEARLAGGLRVAWGNRVELTYNASFTPNSTEPWRSYSVGMRPDLTLTVRDSAGQTRRHALDAKFRVRALGRTVDEAESDDGDGRRTLGRRGFKRADLYKMHAYRDALALDSSWVLYPGQEFRVFSVDGACMDGPTALSQDFKGVGACPLPLGSVGSSLRKLAELLVLD